MTMHETTRTLLQTLADEGDDIAEFYDISRDHPCPLDRAVYAWLDAGSPDLDPMPDADAALLARANRALGEQVEQLRAALAAAGRAAGALIGDEPSHTFLLHVPAEVEAAIVRRDAEIARLQAGGCARDQRTTQYCAEAAEFSHRLKLANEANARLRAGLVEETDDPDSEQGDPRRNCWTCRHDRSEDGLCELMVGRCNDTVRAWTIANIARGSQMPSPEADGCPGWARRP
jgi:hypothetical protein